MSIFAPFIKAWTWFTTKFINHIQSAAHVAFVITETVKTLLANPVTEFLENIADTITGTQIPTNIANLINQEIPKILAVELSIQGLPANPTAADILAFENNIMASFNVTSNNSKLYTVLAAQIYGLIQANITNGTTNFAAWVTAIEQAYIDYKADLAANAPATPAPTPNVQNAVS
jgi:hypothetical protein